MNNVSRCAWDACLYLLHWVSPFHRPVVAGLDNRRFAWDERCDVYIYRCWKSTPCKYGHLESYAAAHRL